MKKRIFALAICVALGVVSASCVFAANENTDKEKRMEFKEPENQVIGKITSIDENNIVISVAKRKEMEKPADKKDGSNPPEKKEFNKDNANKERQEINMDEFFTLTGETKTINIKNADFGKDIDFKDFKPEDNNKENNKEKMDELYKNAKDKTYANYKVGEYVSIECTDSTYKTAKTVRNGRMMGMRGRGDRFDGKKPEEKKQ